MSRGDTRCIEGTLYEHRPQSDDPDFEISRGQCPECRGAGCACDDCNERPWVEVLQMPEYQPANLTLKATTLRLCEQCADQRRDRDAERQAEDAA